MKRIISLFMILVVLFTLAGCSYGIKAPVSLDEGKTTEVLDERKTTEGLDEGKTAEVRDERKTTESLDGKKILFIGNSYTHYGHVVIRKTQSILTQEKRTGDKGYFYQLCKSRGAKVTVTNWCFGGHDFANLFFKPCAADRGCDGENHLDYLTDRYFDYVVMQQSSRSRKITNFLEECDQVMAIFKQANPDVKFLFLVHEDAHTGEYVWLPEVKELAKKGVTIVDWGKLVCDIINGKVSVPGAKEVYNRYSFVVCKSKTDGIHPSILTGYITALMTYCAITGESAVGQDYSFCNDNTINKAFNFQKFIDTYYTYGDITTNFPEVFRSEADMEGIQKLIDRYLEEKPYLEY